MEADFAILRDKYDALNKSYMDLETKVNTFSYRLSTIFDSLASSQMQWRACESELGSARRAVAAAAAQRDEDDRVRAATLRAACAARDDAVAQLQEVGGAIGGFIFLCQLSAYVAVL